MIEILLGLKACSKSDKGLMVPRRVAKIFVVGADLSILLVSVGVGFVPA